MKDREIKKLENHLMAAEENTAPKCRVYNGDRSDVDMDDYIRQVDEPLKHRGKAGWLLLLLLVLAGIALYFWWGGKLPWN